MRACWKGCGVYTVKRSNGYIASVCLPGNPRLLTDEPRPTTGEAINDGFALIDRAEDLLEDDAAYVQQS